MTSAQVVETPVKVTSKGPSQDYSRPDDHNLRTYDMTPGFKPFTKSFSLWQKKFRHGKHYFTTVMAKSISPRQKQFRHGKNIFITAKSFSVRKNHLNSRDVCSQGVMGVITAWRTTLGSFFGDSRFLITLMMFCANCGAVVSSTAKFCVQCGQGKI